MVLRRNSKWVFFLMVINCTLISLSSGIGFGFIARAFSRTAFRNPFPKLKFNMPILSHEEIPLFRFPKRTLPEAGPPPPRSFLADAVPKSSGPGEHQQPPPLNYDSLDALLESQQLPPLNFDSLDTLPKSSVSGVDCSSIFSESTQPKQRPSYVDELPAFAQDKRPESLAPEDGQSVSSEVGEFDQNSKIEESAPEENRHSSEAKKSDHESPHVHIHLPHSSESETEDESLKPDISDMDEKPTEKRDRDGCDFLKFVTNKKIVWKCRQSTEQITTCFVKCRRPFHLANPNSVYVCTHDDGWTPKAIPICI